MYIHVSLTHTTAGFRKWRLREWRADAAHDAMERRARVLFVAMLALLMWLCVSRIGLKAHDVALVYAVAGYATFERRWDRERALLGEDTSDQPVRWWDFVCEQHNVLGCFIKGRRSRSERFLSVAVTTLALLYWKAIFRGHPVKMSSLQVASLAQSSMNISPPPMP